MRDVWDVCVVGAGPAGCAIAAELMERGLRVAIVAPKWPAPWPNNYGVWEDAVPGYEAAIERRFEAPAVRFRDGEPMQTLSRTYVRLDNEQLRAMLLGRCEGVEHIPGLAARVEEHPSWLTLHLEDGEPVRAKLVIDATGHNPALVRRETPHRPGLQVAYGIMIDDPGTDILPQDMVLMDFEAPSPAYHTKASTFLYAMRLEGGRVFLEETSLSGRPAMGLEELERRLYARMRRRGLELEGRPVHEVERCFIPMGGALPVPGQRVLGFGGAASMVHPASGYHMARVLAWAPEVAGAVAQARGSAEMARAGWEALWTADRLRQRELYLYGLEMLLGFDTVRTQEFFERFFELDRSHWSGYMSGTGSTAQLAATMLRLFGHVDGAMRLELMRPALGRKAGHLVRALMPARLGGVR